MTMSNRTQLLSTCAPPPLDGRLALVKFQTVQDLFPLFKSNSGVFEHRKIQGHLTASQRNPKLIDIAAITATNLFIHNMLIETPQ